MGEPSREGRSNALTVNEWGDLGVGGGNVDCDAPIDADDADVLVEPNQR